ncbi:Gfo/Idh/MocA family protein [Paenibacillus sp. GXUN7292]|uniref:Gfo/Idh/MocA family protein n=1 Tax=Paenibacillus sp. GXUN7292 TaxID=3422499 RepID=UPI003D7D1D14
MEQIESKFIPADRPMTAVIVGAGHRSLVYASYADEHPEELQIVAVVDPDAERRQLVADKYQLAAEMSFESVDELVAGPQIADVAINGTMDNVHVATSLPLLAAGYHILLEKPIGASEAEVLELEAAAKRYNRHVMVCHVLRYAPYYAAIRKLIAEDEIGKIIHIHTEENVSYHHMAMAYVRGKWNSKQTGGSSMLMAKCCHDLDLITWMKSGVRPATVASVGSLLQFRPERAPEGSGTRCLADCQIESTCIYSARKHYVEQGLWVPYVSYNEHLGVNQTPDQVLESLRTDNPYGRCVWRCDNDVVDHQSVIVEFEDGSTATHNLNGATAKPCRSIHIIGEKGEIQGVMEDGWFTVRHPDPRQGHEYSERKVELNVSMDMHGGGDLRLVADFINVLRGGMPSLSSTSLEQSLYGHLIGFAADRSREERRTISI